MDAYFHGLRICHGDVRFMKGWKLYIGLWDVVLLVL